MKREPEPRRPSSALEHLKHWLINRHVSEDHAALVVKGVKDFYVDAWGIVDFPVAIGIAGGQEERSLRVHFIWPVAIPAAQRPSYEADLRAAFHRILAAPSAPNLLCQLAFTENRPKIEDDYGCYLGPSPMGYEDFIRGFLASARAVKRSPETAQQIKDLVESLPGKWKEQRREIAEKVHHLAASLHSA